MKNVKMQQTVSPRRTLVVLALLAGTALTGTAMADTVTAKFTGTGKGTNVKAITETVTSNVFSGQLKYQFSNPSGPLAAGLTGNFITFCIELNQNTSSSNQTYTVTSLVDRLGPTKAAAIAGVFASTGLNPLFNTASNDLAAAAQLAVWEIVEDYDGTPGSISLTAGDFRATKTDGSPLPAALTGMATSLLAAVETPSLSSLDFLAISNSSKQDQLVIIPAPGAAAIMALGGLAIARRKRWANTNG